MLNDLILIIAGAQGTNSQIVTIYKLKIQILWKYTLFLHGIQLTNHLKILQQPQHLSCHDMYRIVNWLDYQNQN